MKRKNKVVICAILSFALILPIVKFNTISRANEYDLSNPRVEDYSVTWDCIYFGNYFHNDIDGDGKGDKCPIKWRVLLINENDAFLLSDQNLFHAFFRSDEWKDLSLRSDLNKNFYNDAFTDEEKNAIKETLIVNDNNPLSENNTIDKIFLLSINEATSLSYGFNVQINIASNTRKTTGIEWDNGHWIMPFGDYWYLRSLHESGYLYCVDDEGCITHDVYSQVEGSGVRPALHLDLSKNVWTHADSVTVTTEENLHDPIPTPTIEPTPQPTTTPTPTYTPKPTPKVTTPSKPKISSIKNNKKRTVTLSWNKVSDASGYQLEYATNEAFSKKSKTLKATRVTINKLKKKKIYSFRVRAYALDGDKKLYSKWSTVRRIKIKK